MSPLPAPPSGYEARMPRFAEAQTLCRVGLDAFGREVLLDPAAAEAWRRMHDAAAATGAQLLLLSGFRSIDRQAEIVRQKLERGIPVEDILRVNAYPGFSEHHTGRAVDVGSAACEHLSEAFEYTAEFAWLTAHAVKFGFSLSYPRGHASGVTYEPWHWCWTATADRV